MKVFVGNNLKYNTHSFLIESFKNQFKKNVCESDIDRTDLGKPFFKDKTLPFFSLSHSGKYIVCVFDQNNIGIDIQRIRRMPNNLVKRYLKTNSSDLIKRIIEWTRFESYGKRIGVGLPFEEDYSKGYFLTTKEIKDYIITVCTEKITKQKLEIIYL